MQLFVLASEREAVMGSPPPPLPCLPEAQGQTLDGYIFLLPSAKKLPRWPLGLGVESGTITQISRAFIKCHSQRKITGLAYFSPRYQTELPRALLSSQAGPGPTPRPLSARPISSSFPLPSVLFPYS